MIALYTALAGDIPRLSTQLCRPDVLSIWFLIAVDIQLCAAHDIQLRWICCCFADSGRYTGVVDASISSRDAFTSILKAVDIQLHRASEIQLRQILFCFAGPL